MATSIGTAITATITMNESRAYPRISAPATTATVVARLSEPSVFSIRDLSRGGAGLVGALRLAEGERVQVVLELDHHPITLNAEVVRVDRQRSEVAVAFRGASDITSELIGRSAGADGFARGSAFSGAHDGRTEQRGVVLGVATGARLSGRVSYSTGQPAVGVSIYTETQPGDDRSTTTDADGRFEIVGLGAGRHHVSVGRGRWSSGVVMPGDDEHRELDVELPDPEPTPELAPAQSPPDEPAPVPAPTATLTGRVLRDGAPVSRFAIVRKGLAAYAWTTDPAMIHSADGRFTLGELRESSCTVHVLALGSAWASTATVKLEPGSTLNLGDIVLQRGLRITGAVCNLAGEPIGGAHVAIGGPLLQDDALRDAVEGNFTTTTGADGAFVFDGVHLGHPRVRLFASHPVHGASLHQALSGIDEAFELVLAPTGGIDGEVEPNGMMHSSVIVRADAPDGGGGVVSVRPSGLFVVENLVPGAYTLELLDRPGWPRRVARATVVAGQRTHVRMPPP